MSESTPPPDRALSRRDLLRSAAAVGAAALVATPSQSAESAPQTVGSTAQVPPAERGAHVSGAYEQLTAAEADVLEAIVGRLIPADNTGPGALEAGATRYIDRALGAALASSREAYRRGLAALDAEARASRGTGFAALSPSDQDALLSAMERGDLTGPAWLGGAPAFFALVKAHTWQGTFGDPFYGGNVNFIGWDLLRYPGVRTFVTGQDQQQLEQGRLPVTRRSAYDDPGFEKATVRLDLLQEPHHGD